LRLENGVARAAKLPRPRAVSDVFPENLFPLAQEYAAVYAKRVADGLRQMRDRRVVIAGVVRNSIEVLPHTIERVERLGKFFADYRVVVYENDSIDGTGELLTAWAAGNERVTARCDRRGTPVSPKVRSKMRGETRSLPAAHAVN